MQADSIPAALASACDDVRLAGPADVVAGVQPALVAAPATTGQASALVQAASELGLAVLPRGTGSRMHWGNPPERADLIIETTRMNRVIEHAAGDLVASVEAGVSLGDLAEVLAVAGQRLALDPHPLGPAPTAQASAGGTVGGVIATNVAGPLRLRYGSPRDLLIGITVVRPDGTVARSGGKVVKNVAGYDLGKLFAGSRGTLGLITEATFRLHPRPAATAYVTIECAEPEDCEPLLAAALRAPIAPVSAELSWVSPEAPLVLAIALEGDPAGVAERAARLADMLSSTAGGPAAVGGEPPAWWHRGAAADTDGTVLQIALWPGELVTVLTEIRAAARRTGLDLAVGGAAAAGVLQASAPPDADPATIASFVTGLRSAIGHREPGGNGGAPGRASVVVQHAPAAVGQLVDLFGPVPSLGLMRAVKYQFDPAQMMSPGRFAGGL